MVDRAALRRMPRSRIDQVPVSVDADKRHRVARDGAVEPEHHEAARISERRLVVGIDAGVVGLKRERLVAAVYSPSHSRWKRRGLRARSRSASAAS